MKLSDLYLLEAAVGTLGRVPYATFQYRSHGRHKGPGHGSSKPYILVLGDCPAGVKMENGRISKYPLVGGVNYGDLSEPDKNALKNAIPEIFKLNGLKARYRRLKVMLPRIASLYYRTYREPLMRGMKDLPRSYRKK